MTERKINKVVIFAGGRGTRLAEQTKVTPKPLVQIGPDPVLIHIMRAFYRHGYREFIIAVGYMSEEFKKYFQNYAFAKRDVTFTKSGHQISDSDDAEDWIVRVVETGLDSTTGQRLNAVKKYIAEGEPFFLTYGDSVSDVPIPEIEKSHLENPNHVVTVTAVDKGERFGVLQVTDGKITGFSEKSSSKKQLINGGFIACDYTLFDEVNENSGDLSFETLTNLANEGRMNLYYHDGFWHAMDTQKDVDDLNKIYSQSPELFGY